MKTERVTLLTSPDFKAFLNAEAHREGVSVAELVRTRCERRPTDDEQLLTELTRELKQSVARAKRLLKSGMDEALAVLTELRSQRADPIQNQALVRPQRMPSKAAARPAAVESKPKPKPKPKPRAKPNAKAIKP